MDMETAYLAAKWAQRAYNDENVALKYTAGSMVVWLSDNPEREITFIAYRGTDDIADWLVNVNTLRTYPIVGCFHKGFYEASREITGMGPPDRLRIDFSPHDRDRKLVITGHSLGGALALLHGIRLAYLNSEREVDVYTFGQPRVIGSLETARRVRAMKNLRIWRVVNCNDAVCRVPTRLRGFHHVGEQFYFNSKGQMFRNRGFWGRIKNLASSCGRGMIGDHDMQNYCELVRRAKDHETQN